MHKHRDHQAKITKKGGVRVLAEPLKSRWTQMEASPSKNVLEAKVVDTSTQLEMWRIAGNLKQLEGRRVNKPGMIYLPGIAV